MPVKVWVISESAGYGTGDCIHAIMTTPEKVTEWLTKRCRKENCDLRHDKWCSYEELNWQPASTPEDLLVENKRYHEWAKQFCHDIWSYDIEDWETDE